MEDYETSPEEEKYYLWKAERQQRVMIVMAIVPAIIGVAAISYVNFAPEFSVLSSQLGRSIMRLLAPTALLISGMAVLMIYLQTGFKKREASAIEYLKYGNELRNLRDRMEQSTSVGYSEFEELRNKIAYLNIELSNRKSISEAITSDYKEELVSLLREEIVKESKSEAVSEIIKSIEDKIKGANQLKEVEAVFSRTLERLYSETNALGRRGNLNLSLGIVTTIIGLGILGYFVLEIEAIPEDKMAFIAYFIPRLSLVLLIEVFAYFFLKLYKSILSEIKYFQNEMTNVEAKLAAIKCSIMMADSATTSCVIQKLSETERNAVLKKGQTTADIEKFKIANRDISKIFENLSNALSTIKNV